MTIAAATPDSITRRIKPIGTCIPKDALLTHLALVLTSSSILSVLDSSLPKAFITGMVDMYSTRSSVVLFMLS